MTFEYDPEKSAANKLKHGIDFEAVQALWLDERLLIAPALTNDEPRHLAIGRIAGKHWTVVCTPRGSKTRIISARRSRKEEVERYEST
ncbi:MAG: BrnT family toxin [Panacagrimonas sp.]